MEPSHSPYKFSSARPYASQECLSSCSQKSVWEQVGFQVGMVFSIQRFTTKNDLSECWTIWILGMSCG